MFKEETMKIKLAKLKTYKAIQEWHEWFAWKPVKINEHLFWLCKVMRKADIVPCFPVGSYLSWQYREIICLDPYHEIESISNMIYVRCPTCNKKVWNKKPKETFIQIRPITGGCSVSEELQNRIKIIITKIRDSGVLK